MCLIIDANLAPSVLSIPPKPEVAKLHDALFSRNAIAVYGGKLADEYLKMKSYRGIIAELDRIGSLRAYPHSKIEKETAAVKETGECKSNDEHIIALARISGVRLLCSRDQPLHNDFKNRNLIKPKGSVYQNDEHFPLVCSHCKHS